jgi:hypothetical protein
MPLAIRKNPPNHTIVTPPPSIPFPSPFYVHPSLILCPPSPIHHVIKKRKDGRFALGDERLFLLNIVELLS